MESIMTDSDAKPMLEEGKGLKDLGSANDEPKSSDPDSVDESSKNEPNDSPPFGFTIVAGETQEPDPEDVNRIEFGTFS